MTSKTRARLKSLASREEALFQIGKGEISDNLVEGLNQALEKRELIKVSVLRGCDTPKQELIDILARRLGAQGVAVVGNKLILYRESRAEGVRHIQL